MDMTSPGIGTDKKVWDFKPRGPDRRSNLLRKRFCKTPNCDLAPKRGWRKGYCTWHARTQQGLEDPNPKRNHHAQKRGAPKPATPSRMESDSEPDSRMESDSQPDVFPFPARAEDAELLYQMHDEELAKWQSDPDADIFQYPLRAQDKQMLSKLIFLDSKTKAKAKKEEKPRSQVLRSTFEKESQAALKLINSKKLKKRQNKETKLKRKDIEAMDIELKLMEPLAAVDAELAGSDAEFLSWSDEITLHKPVQGYAPAAASDDVLAESDAEFRSWSDEPQRRSSEEAAAKRQEDEEIWRLKQESRLMSLSEEAAVRSREDMEILGLKREAVVRRREDEISVHKATLRRARLGTARNRLEFDDADFCWPSPPRGRLVWDED